MGLPNFIVMTPPVNDSSFRVANTQFVASAVASAIAALPFSVSSSQVDFISGGIAGPAVQEYRIIEYVPYPMTLNQIAAKLSAGSITTYLKINSSTVTGSSLNALGTTRITSSLTAVNTATTGDVLIVGISATASSPANLSFSIRFTRSLS